MATYVGIQGVGNRSTNVRVPGVTSTSEVQRLAVDATGGTFTVTFNAQTTAAQAFNVAAATLQSQLEGLSSVGVGNVLVTGGPGNAGATTPYILTFRGSLAGQNQPQATTNAASLTGGASTATVTTTTQGGAVTLAPTKLRPDTVTVVNVDDIETRKALNHHKSIGAFVVVAVRNSTATAGTLPANS